MSATSIDQQQHQSELEALTTWLHTFPVVQEVAAKSSSTTRSSSSTTTAVLDLDDKKIVKCVGCSCCLYYNVNAMKIFTSSNSILIRRRPNSAIFEVAGELCGSNENSNSSDTLTLQGHSGDVWDAIWSLTPQGRRNKAVPLPPDTPHSSTPQTWIPLACLAALLEEAVGHANMEQRKEYIERIMSLESTVQHVLMSLIERRKQMAANHRTPKKQPHRSSTKKKNTSGRPSLGVGELSPLTSPNRGRGGGVAHRPTSSATKTPSPARNLRSISTTPSSVNVKATPPNTTATEEKQKQTSPRRSFDQAFSSPGLGMTPTPKRSSSRGRPSLLSPGLGDTAAIEREFEQLREQSKILQRQISGKERREQELQDALEQTEHNFRHELLKVESRASRRQEEITASYQQTITELQQQLSNLNTKYEIAKDAQTELAKVQDDRDLLQHTQTQLVELQERLSTYREKVQLFGDVKEALKREEEAHSKSVSENLRLQDQLSNLQPLQRQLEEYKQRATEAEFKATETEARLSKLQEDGLLNGTASTDLEKTCQAQQEEIRELRLRLQQESRAAVMTEDSVGGVGSGLSELNPELKEEVLRLRSENERLQAFMEARSEDSVTKLQEQMDDTQRLADRYKTQYLSTREQLEHTQDQWEASKQREAKLRLEIQDCRQKVQALQTNVEETSQTLYQTQETLCKSQTQNTELETELSEWMGTAKELQEDLASVSSQMRTTQNDLEASQGRESKLQTQLDGSRQDFQDAEASHDTTRHELSALQETLQASEKQVADLRDQLDDWMGQTQKLKDKVDTLNGQVDSGKTALVEAKATKDRLAEQVTQTTQFLSDANAKCESLQEDLSTTRQSLVETKVALETSQQHETDLTRQFQDMKERAHSFEGVANERQDAIHILQAKLQHSQDQVAELEVNARQLQEDLEGRGKELEKINLRAQGLQSTLSATLHQLQEVKSGNDEYEVQVTNLKEKLNERTQTMEQWKTQAVAATDQVTSLQEDLSQVQEALEGLQTDLLTSRSNEQGRSHDVVQAQRIILALEDRIENEETSRHLVEEALEKAQSELSQLQQTHHETQEELDCQRSEYSQHATQWQQDLSSTQTTLAEVESFLNASQHREKMLQLEIAQLQATINGLQDQLQTAQETMERQVTDASRSIESTCQVLQAKAHKDLEEAEHRLTQLLEQERATKRAADEAHQEQLREIQQTYTQKVEELQTSVDASKAEAKHLKEVELEQVRAEYEDQLARLKEEANQENSHLLSKGKGMLKEVKTKAKEENEALLAQFQELEERLGQEQAEREKLIVQAKTKVAGYKKKLEFATSRVSTLTSDVDELEERIKGLEREKFKLVEENDRYRRQIGGRGGPDSKLQVQFEQLQKEFKAAMEEARELKRKLKANQSGGLGSIDEDEDLSGYSRNAVNQSTLGQLRAEYEEMIEVLNDEKRELVMKNSAAATDVQKAEKRAWETEQENSELKQFNTSLQLQVERLEVLMGDHHNRREDEDTFDDDNVIPPPPADHNNDIASYSSRKSSRRSVQTREPTILESEPMLDEEAIELKRAPTELSTATSIATSRARREEEEEEARDDEVSVLSPLPPPQNNNSISSSCPPEGAITKNAATKAGELPSFVQLHESDNDPAKPEVPPECQQS